MSLPRIPARVVKIAEALDRADTPEELDAAWDANDCAHVRGAAGIWLRERMHSIRERHRRQARALVLARAY